MRCLLDAICRRFALQFGANPWRLSGWLAMALVAVAGWPIRGEEPTTKTESATSEQATPFQAGIRKFTLNYKPPKDAEEAERTRNVYLWYPTTEEAPRYNYHPLIGFAKENAAVADGKHPLVLFSHGFLGAADQTIFLTEELARQGYIVAALDHADSLRFKRDKKMEPADFGHAKSWTDEKFRDRQQDMVALLDYVLKLNDTASSYLQNHVDPRKVGAVGHSLGGYTVLGLAGGWPSWKEKRIHAIVAMSPYAAPYIVNGDLPAVSIPVMLQGGTWDFGITPLIPSIYDRLQCPRYYLVLKNENHFGWTNLASLGKTTKECIADGNPELMTRYTVDFFNETLCGEDCPRLTADEQRLDKLLTHENGGQTSGNANLFLERALERRK